MLAHPTLDHLHALGLYGLAKGFKELEHKPEARGLEHAEWLGLLLEYELSLRRQKQFETRARVAKLRHPASVEDVNYQSPRGLDRALFLKLAACDWLAERTCPFSTPACLGSSRISPSPTATRVTPSSCAPWPASSCSFSMTGVQRRSPPTRRAICWRSSRIVTTRARSSSPARFPWTAGTI